MKYLFLASLLLLTSCGYNIDCNYSFYAAGIVFCYEMPFTSPPNTQMIEEIITDIETVSRIYYPRVHNLRGTLADRNTTVYVTRGDIQECKDAPSSPYYICHKNIGGYNSSEDGLIVIEETWPNNTCLLRSAFSAFMHEVLHTVDYAYLGGDAHDTPFLFIQNYNTTEEIHNTIEWKISKILESRVQNYPENCK